MTKEKTFVRNPELQTMNYKQEFRVRKSYPLIDGSNRMP